MSARRLITVLLLYVSASMPLISVSGSSGQMDMESAISLYRQEGAEKALPEFERLYSEFSDRDDRKNAARARRYIGESHWQLGNYDQSRVYLEAALADMRKLGWMLGEGKTLNVLGLLEWDLGNYDQAISDFEQASQIAAQLGNNRLAGSTLNNMSLVYDEMGDYRTSLAGYQRALKMYEGADFPRGESDTLGNIGGVNLLLGRYEEALGNYQHALTISEMLESKPAMSLDHGNLALCYLGLGRTDTALMHFETALSLAREAGMRKEEALWLRGKANALIRKGQYGLGLENHRVALQIYRQIEARGLLLDALHDMGRLHLTLGDPLSAEAYFEEAIELASDIGLEQAITVNLLSLGDLQLRRERLKEAIAMFRQALDRSSKAGELNYQAESLLRLSVAHRKQQRYQQADAEARQALELAIRTEAKPVAAEAWFAIAEVARADGDLGAAVEAYSKAQAVSAGDTDPELLWQIHYGRAQALIQQGKRLAAVSELEAAVKVIEAVRARIREDRFKAGYVQDKYKVYVELVRLQLELGKIPDAFSTAERLRARSFLEQLESAGPVELSDEDQRQEYALRERVRQLHSALQVEQKIPPRERRQMAIDTFSSELLTAQNDYQAFLDDMQGRYVMSHAVRVPDIGEVQSRLRPREALLEYVIGDGQVMIFVLKQSRLEALSVDLRQIDLVAKVSLVRELIQQPASGHWWAPAASLSGSLLDPVFANGILEETDHLYLVPHGILNYLPFALLPLNASDDQSVVMERFTLSYLPAAATLVQQGGEAVASQSLLAMAPARSRLEHALLEARSITEMYRHPAKLLSGNAATESAFKDQAGAYGLLHLSTHGYFNSANPLLSGLELEPDDENDGLLEVHEILRLSLDARLVTLSACETGLGGGYFNQIPAGDEFVGLTRAFLLAGSRSVLATLWPVDDRSTVDLMEGFYQRLEPSKGRHMQALALADVQRELRKSEKYRHPFYWAAFILVSQQDQVVHVAQN